MSALSDRGVPLLAEAGRNLRALAEHVQPVLVIAVGGETDVKAIARKAQITEVDCRRALFYLEELGLVESSRYVATASGRQAMKA